MGIGVGVGASKGIEAEGVWILDGAGDLESSATCSLMSLS